MRISKEQLKGMLMQPKPVACSRDWLPLDFVFRRMGGEEIMLRKLVSSKSEMEMQMLTRYEVEENLSKFCNEEMKGLVKWRYDFREDMYYFQNVLGMQ